MIKDIHQLVCLGSALSFATSDVTTKLNHVQNRTKEMMMAGLIDSSYEDVTIEVGMDKSSKE